MSSKGLRKGPDPAASVATVRRLTKRHALVVAPFVDDLRGARVLDLGAHDGRWCHAFAAAGAREVLAKAPVIELVRERTDKPLNAVAQIGQPLPSIAASQWIVESPPFWMSGFSR
jgi:hypothetical protein